MFKMLRMLRRASKRFKKNSTGAAGVEFALVSPIFFALIFSIFEMGLVFTRIALVEDATRTAAREIYVGAATAGSFTQDDLETLICNQTFGFFPCDDSITVEVTVINNVSDIPDTDATCDESGDEINPAVGYTTTGREDNVFVRVCATVAILTPGLGLGLALDKTEGNNYEIISSFVFKNEPF